MTEYMEMILTGASLEDLLKEARVEVEEFEEAQGLFGQNLKKIKKILDKLKVV